MSLHLCKSGVVHHRTDVRADRRSGLWTEALASSGRENPATRQLAEAFSAETLDSLIKDAVKSGTPIDGADGLLNWLTKAVLERSLQTR